MRRLVVAAMAVVALGVGIGTNVADGRLEPFGARGGSGAIGEDVSAYPYTVHVTEAVVATSLVELDFEGQPTTIGSDGVWVVLTLSYATARQSASPSGSGVLLRAADGREYPVSRRSPESQWMAGPDIWVRGDLAFEVPADAVDGLELVFNPVSQIFGPMPVQYAVIPLDLDLDAIVPEVEVVRFELLDEGER